MLVLLVGSRKDTTLFKVIIHEVYSMAAALDSIIDQKLHDDFLSIIVSISDILSRPAKDLALLANPFRDGTAISAFVADSASRAFVLYEACS